MKLLRLLGTLMLLPFAAGCSTIYVANVKFSAPEICSEELASRLNPNSGCLPPTRVANVQRMYLERFRAQVSPSQASKLDEAAKDGAEIKNFMPSVLGRVFVISADKETGLIVPPKDGNLEFLPLGNVQASTEPERNLKIEVSLRSDINGATDRQSAFGVSVDPATIASNALKAAGIPDAASKPFRDALTDKVASLSHATGTQDSSVGSYMYVTLTATELDSLNQVLAVCGMTLPSQDKHDSSEQVSWRDQFSLMATTGEMPKAHSGHKGNAPDACDRALGDPMVLQSTKDLVSAIRAEAAWRPEVDWAGIIVGTAILRTKGKSQMCSKQDIGLVASGQSPISSATCADLKSAVDKESLPQSNLQPATAPALTNAQQATLLMSISAQLSESNFKGQDLYQHTSMLAFHWIPIRLHH